MKSLSNTGHKALMADLRSSCSDQLPSVSIFWYNPEEYVLLGIRKEELSSARGEAELSPLIEEAFSLPCFELVFDPHL